MAAILSVHPETPLKVSVLQKKPWESLGPENDPSEKLVINKVPLSWIESVESHIDHKPISTNVGLLCRTVPLFWKSRVPSNCKEVVVPQTTASHVQSDIVTSIAGLLI